MLNWETWENPFSSLFLALRTAFSHILGLMAPSSNFKASSTASSHLSDVSSIVTSPPLTLTPLPPSSKDPCDYRGLTCIIQDSLPIEEPFTSSHLRSAFQHVTYLQVLSIRTMDIFRGHDAAYHKPQTLNLAIGAPNL